VKGTYKMEITITIEKLIEYINLGQQQEIALSLIEAFDVEELLWLQDVLNTELSQVVGLDDVNE